MINPVGMTTFCTETGQSKDMDKPKIIVVSGTKNVGKTTLITKLVSRMSEQGIKVAVIKHDAHDFDCDMAGTDSYAYTQAGAYGSAVFSDHRMFVHRIGTGEREEELIRFFPDADIILLEGFKGNARYPKVEVIRREISDTLVASPKGRFLIVSDMQPDEIKGRAGEPVLPYEAVDQIIESILKQ